MEEQLEGERPRSSEDGESELRSKMAALVTEIDERLAEIKRILAEKVHERKEAA